MSGNQMRRTLTREQWQAEGERRFGEDVMDWRFVCPSCGHVASVRDWKAAGASGGGVAFSCIGRWLSSSKRLGEKPGPCNYAGGGLIRLNPVTVVDEDGVATDVFEFDLSGRAA